MDPNATLQEALEALADLTKRDNDDDRYSAAIRLQELASWLRLGNFAPRVVQCVDGSFRIEAR